MLTAVALIVFGALCRIVPHPPNFSPMGGVSLYAGARLPRRWAWIVPLVATALADTFIDLGAGMPTMTPVRLTIYATYAAVTLLASKLPRERMNPWLLPAWSVGTSTFFFVTWNLASWWWDGLFPRTFEGLVACYASAVPFFGNTVVADLLGTSVLFGLGALARRFVPLATGEEPAPGRAG